MEKLIESDDVTLPAPRISVLGLGHVGLPTALGFAEIGWSVIGCDEDEGKVRLIESGQAPFYEPGLQEMLSRQLESGRFILTSDVAKAVRATNLLFICVGTPQSENGDADLTQIEQLARLISQNLNGYKLIVEKSTVPAITALWIKKTVARYASIHQRSSDGDGHSKSHYSDSPQMVCEFDVASNPEFLQEGRAVENFFHPDRLIVGVDSERARKLFESIYRPLGRPILVTDVTTAELIKHAANAFLSTKISFINMVADVCEAVGADVTMVARGLGSDPRIGPQFLSAGIGFGGYCFPKDLRAFIRLAEQKGVNAGILKEVECANLRRVDNFLQKLGDALWVVRGKTIAVLGLAFKPNTDDIREAPSLRIIEALLESGASVRLYDPQAIPAMRQVFPERLGQITYCSSSYEACEGAEAVALLTEWEEFRQLDLCRVRELVALPILVDGRNMFSPESVRDAGFEYISMGRVNSGPTRTDPVALKSTASRAWGYANL